MFLTTYDDNWFELGFALFRLLGLICVLLLLAFGLEITWSRISDDERTCRGISRMIKMIGMVSFWMVIDLVFLFQQVNHNHSLINQVLNLMSQCPAIFDFMPKYIHVIIAMNMWIKPYGDTCPSLGLNEFVFYEPGTHGKRSSSYGAKARFSFSTFLEYGFDSRRVLVEKNGGSGGFE